MEKYFSGQDLITQLDMEQFQLHELVEQGLEPHDSRTGLVIRTVPGEYAWLQDYKRRIGELTSLAAPRPRPALPVINGGRSWSVPPAPEKTKRDIAELQAEIEAISARGIELPQLTDPEWATCIVLDRSRETYARLTQAKYKQSQFLALQGNLPNSCPNQSLCLDAYHNASLEGHEITGSQVVLRQPSYLDTSHDFFSYELKAAVECWQHLFVNGKLKTGKSVKAGAIEWLGKNHPVLSDEAKSRIATVINPDRHKRGGVPRMPDK
jgi:hypothetical protein